MKLPRRQFLQLTMGAAALSTASRRGWAQAYPARPITIIVPFAAGGPTDTVARIVAARMRESLGQSVIIENVAGADGTIGVARAARASPDGYTLSAGQWGTHVLNGAAYTLQYDVLKDFEPIALLTSNPYILVGKKGLPAKNLQELLAWVKANDGKVTAGIGSMGSRVCTVYFEKMTGARVVIVPYRGAAPALQDVLAGTTDLIFDQPSNSLPNLRAGNTKAYGVTSKVRMPDLPDIPTLIEAGLDGFEISIWNAIWAPKSTPKEVVARLNAAIVDALANPDVRARLIELGQELPPREQQTPEALATLQKAEIAKWWPIVKEAGIKPD
jgi:tripartite-type tricarboxylate transporter receptor subunit TctC